MKLSSRRQFVKSNLLAATSTAIPFYIPRDKEKIKLGIVGVGWWGIEFLINFALASGRFEIVGICDVSSKALTDATSRIIDRGGAPPQKFSNYQDLYDLADLQAVAIASPTHWHALQFIDACNMGLDVWLEKPISYDIREGQAMLAAHQKANNIVSVDFPRLYTAVNSEVKDFIQSGQAGEIYQVDFNIHNPAGYPDIMPIPGYFDYEAFCGPAPKVPYRSGPQAIRPGWRAQAAFSRGVLADWGIHYLQNIRRVMDLTLPDQISAIGGNSRKDGREHPDHLDVIFQFADLPVKWNQKSWGYTSPLPHTNIGVFYYGSKATIFASDTGWEVYPADGSAMKTFGEPRLAYGQGKYMEMVQKVFLKQFNVFADAIKTKTHTGIEGTFDDGFLSTACVNYADLAYRSKAPVIINKNSMEIKGNEAANKMLKRNYREGYAHPYTH